MSVGRRIEDGSDQTRTARLLQGLRASGVILCMVISSAMLWRWGIPPRLNAQAGVHGFLWLVATGLFLGYARRRWRGRLGALDRVAERFDPNRRLKLTTDGRILIGITLAVGAAAVNTGNNFLYLVLGLLLALVSVSGVLSEFVLRDVRVRMEPGGERFAGQPGVLAFHVFNQKARMASMSVEVNPLVAQPGAGPRDVPLKVPGRFFMRLLPSGRERAVVRLELGARGVHRLAGFEVATSYPFGFFRKWKHEVPEGDEPSEILVFPAPAPVQGEVRRITALIGERPSGVIGRGDEYHSLRNHRTGDDLRRVAWKRSARMGRLLVREDEEPRGRAMTLVLTGGIEHPSETEVALYERAVSVCTGLALELLRRGDEVGLVAGTRVLPPRTGALARELILDALARVSIHEQPAPPAPESERGAFILVEGPGRLPPLKRVDVRVGGQAPRTVRRAA
ncbi:MAG: DUF58 domain-containing protein [Myxococcota bacterium]